MQVTSLDAEVFVNALRPKSPTSLPPSGANAIGRTLNRWPTFTFRPRGADSEASPRRSGLVELYLLIAKTFLSSILYRFDRTGHRDRLESVNDTPKNTKHHTIRPYQLAK